MKVHSRLHLFNSRLSHSGRATASLKLGLLLAALALLSACQAGTSPADVTPSQRPPAPTSAKPTARLGTRTPALPTQPGTVAPYPPESTQPADAYPYPGPADTKAPPPPTPTAPPTPTSPPTQPAAGVRPYQQYFPFLAVAAATPTPLPTSTPQPTSPPRPEPSDTPRPTWPEPLSGQTTSKLGLHIIAVYPDPDIMEFVRRLHPRVAMAPYDQAGVAEIKAASPSTLTISRFDVKGQERWVTTIPDAAAAANHYVEANLEKYRQNPAVDYWEGMNEFIPQTPADWQWFTQFEATRACAMQAQGLHAAIGAFAVGWPRTYDEMTIFLPALEAAHRCGAILTIHEYNGPTMDCGVATNAPGIIPGAPALNVPAGPLTLRYRFWYESFLKPRGMGDLPLVISELGADGGPPNQPCQGPGQGWTWKRYQPSWIQQGIAATGGEAYVNVLAWYDNEIKKDPYVIGAAIFTTGEFASTSWAPFDIHDALRQLAQYEARP